MLQRLTAIILQKSAFLLHNTYIHTSGVNKHNMYIADKRSCNMLKLAAKFGFVTDLLYIAMYHYKTFRHREALSVIEMAKVKLAQPGLMREAYVDVEGYTEAVGGQSWSTKMRNAAENDIKLQNNICCITEIKLEQQSSSQNKRTTSRLFIPSFIRLHMLELLCLRHCDTKEQKQR